ncbi:tRNA-specific adenosine deaminase-like protein 3 [Babesia caballi]|uniref:tRNA-specific adenosine deaminase-like protein 3 n=1 Tax=Babesia caballi TaxID=5871 RepID=A0AAV4LY56_BABCB|nr:tRNA-specific adenosine deaminase-like protein 3 [Babesia caballi]
MADPGEGCAASDADFVAGLEVEEVLGEQFTRDIEFLELKAIEIDRCHTQRALQLTESARKVMLPGNLQYVRMCKALDAQRLLLIYGRSDEMPFRVDLEQRGIQIHAVHTVKVPRYSPSTVEQYQQWSKYWPLKFLKPSVTPVRITRLVVYATGEKLKLRFPQLYVTWEILDYDAPAALRVEFLNGAKKRYAQLAVAIRWFSYIIEGYSKPEREKLVAEWQFNAKLEPWPETLAPTLGDGQGRGQGDDGRTTSE